MKTKILTVKLSKSEAMRHLQAYSEGGNTAIEMFLNEYDIKNREFAFETVPDNESEIESLAKDEMLDFFEDWVISIPDDELFIYLVTIMTGVGGVLQLTVKSITELEADWFEETYAVLGREVYSVFSFSHMGYEIAPNKDETIFVISE